MNKQHRVINCLVISKENKPPNKKADQHLQP